MAIRGLVPELNNRVVTWLAQDGVPDPAHIVKRELAAASGQSVKVSLEVFRSLHTAAYRLQQESKPAGINIRAPKVEPDIIDAGSSVQYIPQTSVEPRLGVVPAYDATGALDLQLAMPGGYPWAAGEDALMDYIQGRPDEYVPSSIACHSLIEPKPSSILQHLAQLLR